jgi:hypothetical protein
MTAGNRLANRLVRQHSQQHESPRSDLRGKLTFAAFATGIAIFSYHLRKANRQDPVLDKSVLKYTDLDSEHLYIVNALHLLSASHTVTSGRSAGHRVRPRQKHLLHDSESYYYKEPFGRKCLLNELVYGALGRTLIGKEFPEVYAVETPLNDLEDTSRYSFISENVGDALENLNLEEWAVRFSNNQHEGRMPARLGVALAFDLLFGKSDSKLANLVIVSDNNLSRHGACYSIDHESCGTDQARFLTNPEDGLVKIGEYSKKTCLDVVFDQQMEGTGINTNDNPHQPLKSDDKVKNSVAPVLYAAMENEINNGKVMQMYQRFAAIKPEDIDSIFARYGTLLTTEERQEYTADILKRQAATKHFLAEQELDNRSVIAIQKVEDHASSLSRKY